MTIAHHTVPNPDIVATVPGDGVTGYILYDRDPEDPRTWGNAGRMLCWHSRYTLGDTHDYSGPGEWLSDVLTMSTGRFSCQWDSGRVGWAILTHDEIAREFNGDRDRAVEYLTAQVGEYDQYLTGDTYGYVIEDSDGEELHAY